MILRIPVIFTDIRDWVRKASFAINMLIVQGEEARLGPEKLDADPSDAVAGRFYYNTTTNKARVFDGTAWNDLW